MQEKGYILLFQTILTHYGFNPVIVRDESGSESIECPIGKDNKKRPLICQVHIFEETLHVPHYIKEKFTPPDSHENLEYLIHLSLILPFKAKKESASALALELLRINKTTLFPGFGFDEITGEIFYRYTFLRPGSIISRNQFLSILGMILLLVDTFGANIEQVSNPPKIS